MARITPPSAVKFGATLNITKSYMRQKGWKQSDCEYLAWTFRGTDGKAGLLKGKGDDAFVLVNNDPEYDTLLGKKEKEGDKLITQNDYNNAKKKGKTFLYECDSTSPDPTAPTEEEFQKAEKQKRQKLIENFEREHKRRQELNDQPFEELPGGGYRDAHGKFHWKPWA